GELVVCVRSRTVGAKDAADPARERRALELDAQDRFRGGIGEHDRAVLVHDQDAVAHAFEHGFPPLRFHRVGPVRSRRRSLSPPRSTWQGSLMGLFDRASRAVSANFNALLDRLEDPKKEIDLTVSEMEEQVRNARQEIVRSVASEKQLKKMVDE